MHQALDTPLTQINLSYPSELLGWQSFRWVNEDFRPKQLNKRQLSGCGSLIRNDRVGAQSSPWQIQQSMSAFDRYR